MKSMDRMKSMILRAVSKSTSRLARMLASIVTIALLVVGSNGCKSFGGEDEDADWMVFKGSALNSDSPTTATLVAENPAMGPLMDERFRATEFESSAVAPLPSVKAEAAQREAFARAEGRRAALRSLAERILIHQPEGSRGNVSLILERVPSGVEDLEGLLESASTVTYQKSPDSEAVEARAVITGATISDAYLNKAMEQMRASSAAMMSNLSAEDRVVQAEELALESARVKAMNHVMGINSSAGTMDSLAQKDPQLLMDVRNWIYAAKHEPFTHSPDGLCETSIKLDMNKPFEMIAKATEQVASESKKKSAKKKTTKKSPTKTPAKKPAKPKQESTTNEDEPLPAAPIPAAPVADTPLPITDTIVEQPSVEVPPIVEPIPDTPIELPQQ